MEIFNSYTAVIAISIIIIVSYFFNIISEKTNIPSVLLLIVSGVLVKLGFDYFEISTGGELFSVLEILGIVGLIMIVLEAALDLELSKEKWPVIWKSFTIALLSLFTCSFVIAFFLNYVFIDNFTVAMVYSIPLSIISSAIVIPSVGELSEDKAEFMVYESTFSDILGIMYFYFLIGNLETENVSTVVWDVVSNIFITILLSVAISYLLVFIFQRVKTQVKLFLLTAVLILLYSIGKLFHLSSLLIILIFGLVLNNHEIFFRGSLKKLIKISALKSILRNFHLITIETAFVVRTFFFLIFGITIDLNSLLSVQDFIISLSIVVAIFGIRLLYLRMFRGKDLIPELFIAPRGLITILLFFAIPVSLQIDFNSGILLYTILITSVVMAMSLIARGKHIEPVNADKMAYWREIDKEIESIPESEKHKDPKDEEEDEITDKIKDKLNS